MPTPAMRLTAVTRAERNEIISAVSASISAVGGWIDDVSFFSNISVALRFIIPSSSGPALALLIAALPMKIDNEGLTNLDAVPTHRPGKEITCSLQVTFFHGEPDLRRHIPSVPG